MPTKQKNRRAVTLSRRACQLTARQLEGVVDSVLDLLLVKSGDRYVRRAEVPEWQVAEIELEAQICALQLLRRTRRVGAASAVVRQAERPAGAG
jgi:hypothetical protein